MNTLVLKASINSLIKTLCFLDYWGPGEISWFSRLPGKVPDVARCNQPLPEIQSLPEETLSKYPNCVLKAQKVLFNQAENGCLRVYDESERCTIYAVGLTWVDCGHELWVKPWKYTNAIKIPAKLNFLTCLFMQFGREEKLSDLNHLANVFSSF